MTTKNHLQNGTNALLTQIINGGLALCSLELTAVCANFALIELAKIFNYHLVLLLLNKQVAMEILEFSAKSLYLFEMLGKLMRASNDSVHQQILSLEFINANL